MQKSAESDSSLRVRIAEAQPQDATISANEWGELGRKANASAQEYDTNQCHGTAAQLRIDALQCFEFELQLRRLATVSPEEGK